MSTVPVITTDGRIAHYLDGDFAATLKGVRLVCDRKGHVIRVLLNEESPMVQELLLQRKPSNWGRSFTQTLNTVDAQRAAVFALRGVRGSH